jgi:hypothetical protein
VSTTGGYNSGCNCGRSNNPEVAEHSVTIQVVDALQRPVDGVLVTVWVIDVDQPGPERAPIVAGTSATDGDGLAQFTYTSTIPPYVCGFRVMDATSTNVLADHPPTTSEQLSNPSGQLTVVVP